MYYVTFFTFSSFCQCKWSQILVCSKLTELIRILYTTDSKLKFNYIKKCTSSSHQQSQIGSFYCLKIKQNHIYYQNLLMYVRHYICWVIYTTFTREHKRIKMLPNKSSEKKVSVIVYRLMKIQLVYLHLRQYNFWPIHFFLITKNKTCTLIQKSVLS